MRKLKLILNAVKETLNDQEVLQALNVYKHNTKRIKGLYKQAIEHERKTLVQLVLSKAKSNYFAQKLKDGHFETIFD